MDQKTCHVLIEWNGGDWEDFYESVVCVFLSQDMANAECDKQNKEHPFIPGRHSSYQQLFRVEEKPLVSS